MEDFLERQRKSDAKQAVATDEALTAFKAHLAEKLKERANNDRLIIGADSKRAKRQPGIWRIKKIRRSTPVPLKDFELWYRPRPDGGPFGGETVAEHLGITTSPESLVKSDSDEVWDIHAIERECKWVEVNKISSKNQIWKIKYCAECRKLFLADYQSQKFHLRCSMKRRRRGQSDWQGVPKNKEAAKDAKRQQYWQEHGGNVRHYTR